MFRTSTEFDECILKARSLFVLKMKDYGTAWRVLRPASVTDQIFIKINRLRTVQIRGTAKVEEQEEESFIAIINYSIMGLIQLDKGVADQLEDSHEQIQREYDKIVYHTKELMERKNHDYGEAWRTMRLTSIIDLMYQKVLRTKQIEDNNGQTLASEGIGANYFDLINYAVFCLIKLNENE